MALCGTDVICLQDFWYKKEEEAMSILFSTVYLVSRAVINT